jgi:3-phenylpropionate/trans-cinnamate dioxygenase ferredoxin reductase subunit
MRSVVVIGAGIAALRTIEELRRLGSEDDIVLVGAEQHLPYDRPPLTKEFLRDDRPTPWLSKDFDELGVQTRLGRLAVGLDTHHRQVRFDDGSELHYDNAVIATGATPRRLPGLDGAGAHVVRTVDDARALRRDLLEHDRLVVIGAGFIGCEVAASARAMGVPTTLVEVLSAPLVRVLGAQVAAEVARMHRDAQVDLRCNTRVVEFRGTGPDRELVLSDDTIVFAPVVVAGLGVTPQVEWLDGSGVDIDDGIVCDAQGRSSEPGVWAVGDVARWWYPALGRHVRLEHWTTAVEQGRTVARALMGQPAAVDPVPYFWSDQHGVKLQMLGLPQPDDEVVTLRVGPHDRLLALYGRDGTISGVLGFSAGRYVMRLRESIAAGAAFAAVVDAAAA